jgi:hypothetical protein
MSTQDYIVDQIIEITKAKFGDRVKFKVQGLDDILTAFPKYPLEIGKRITGYIQDGQYGKDFKFGRSNSTPNPMPHQPGNAEIKNIIELKLIPMLQHIEAHLDRIEKYVTGEEVETKKLDTTFEDKIQPDDIPF